MKFYKFQVLKNSSEEFEEDTTSKEETMLINQIHIVSLKPIRLSHKGHIYEAYWLRLTNGKKYRALQIPIELKLLLENNDEMGQPIVAPLIDEQPLALQ